MDLVIGNVDINLVGHKPFIHRDETCAVAWRETLKKLQKEFLDKGLRCASDSYITETSAEVRVRDLFDQSGILASASLYVSHVFHQNGCSVDTTLDNIIPVPDSLGSHAIKKFRIKRLVAGAAGTGTALHKHSRAYFYNVTGKKRWFLACPTEENVRVLSEYEYDVNNKRIVSIGDWFGSDLEILSRKLEKYCVIDMSPGDCLYIPDGFYHAILNLEFTIGVAYSWEAGDQNSPQ